MERNYDDSSPLTLESNQCVDTFVQISLDQSVTARLLSFRCQEAQAQSLPCQDYATVMSQPEGASICFCVCDGVGSSYKGDFAAAYLAKCLLGWLQKLAVLPHTSTKLLKTLRPYLDQWAHEAQMALLAQPIPPELPALVQEVLTDVRNTYGSETVFLCGRIDAIKTRSPHLLSRTKRVRVLFCWMGNVNGQVFTTGNRSVATGEKGNDYNRWSTARGRHGVVKARIFTFDTIKRLTIHTDGLDRIADELADLSDEALQTRVQQLLALPTSDDMTLLDLRWQHPPSQSRQARQKRP
ncbi:MAG: protein phosphatase 2C domain-containing protein [Ktedonobacteraceae bacterium]|nr:protein phosphatase 2C domain-containing protein [Ktedonobacteraceae bacterium]